MMSPTVRYNRHLSTPVLAQLRAYFDARAAALDPSQRARIAEVLESSCQSSAE